MDAKEFLIIVNEQCDRNLCADCPFNELTDCPYVGWKQIDFAVEIAERLKAEQDAMTVAAEG